MHAQIAALSAHRPQLEGYLTRLTGDADLACDAAQEAYARLTVQPPADRSNLRAWLYTVATNHVLDTQRVSRRRRELLVENADAAPVGSASPAADVEMERAERRAAVRKAMDLHLREKERRVLTLRAEGYSYREVSELVDIPVNSVGVVAARALRKLAAVLAPQEDLLS